MMNLVSVACNLLLPPLHPSPQADGSVWRLTEQESASQRHDVTTRHPALYNRGEDHKHTHVISLLYS